MLTASLQSTWEQKNRNPSRQKYGSYGQQSGEETDLSKSIAYGSHDRSLGKSSNYSSHQSQQQSYFPASNGSNPAELPNLKMPHVGGRANVGFPPNGLSGSAALNNGMQQQSNAGPSPRGGGGGNYSGNAGYNSIGGGLGAGNSIYLNPQASVTSHQQHLGGVGGVGGVGGMGVPSRKHRGSSRQSNHKSNRRGHNHHHNRYSESPNYGAPHGAAEGGGGGGSKYVMAHHSNHGPGHGQTGGYQQQLSSPSPNSTMQMNGAGDVAGHFPHQHQQHQHQHGASVLPQISGVSGGFAASAAAAAHNNNSGMMPPVGNKQGGGGGGNLRSQYLSQMNSATSAVGGNHHSGTMTVPGNTAVAAPGGGGGGVVNPASISAFNITTAPVIREFQQGNVLTNTEEHAHSSVSSIRGMKPGNPNWINQDNFFVSENFDGRDIRIYCVLDGHGEHGHLVSRRCRDAFPQFIKSSRLDIDSAFNMMQNDLNASSDMDVRCSGATCVMATLIGGRLSVYNCGDSRAVLGRRNPNGSIYAVALSKDHKPDKAEERKRILSCGGHLGCRQVLVNQPGRGPVSMPVGPCRVWYQHRGETLGLAMSRSLGDSIVHKSGVSAEPECTDRVIDDYDEFLILATDGVWDVVDNNYAVQLVQSFAAKSANWSALEAANSVCRFARSRWEKLSPMIDDITCIVVKVHR
mmetsp:Transcript_119560/g.235030  ORF Transcript_119560/g.235030 Transcript_119560/m.235030 type:complete len:688 (+) Transcript_119560:302-2365(+)